MYLRIVKFTFKSGQEASVQPAADDLVGLIKQQPGCLGAVFFAEKDGQSGISALWATRENADAAAVVVRPKLDAHLAGRVAAPPQVDLFPVIAGWIAPA